VSDVLADATAWESLGSAIRERRLARGRTLVDVATDAELSQPFLSQVETGRARPSMASLYRIARALDTTPQALFGGPRPAVVAPVVVRRAEVPEVPLGDPASDHGATCRLLLTGDTPFHVVELCDLPGEHLGYWSHDGFEAVHVTQGVVELDVAGELTVLRPGDVASYPARSPHRLRGLGRASTRVLLVETTVESLQEAGPAAHLPGRRRRRTRSRSAQS
jgi:quercetin dioxygenase-like cupin family protein